jgi:hypothetical protein
MGNWRKEAADDAILFIDEYKDAIVEQIMDNKEASDELNYDYDKGAAFIHESYIDKEYDLLDAAQLLKDLRDYKETDSGLWKGQEPEQAISTQAAFTYGNVVVVFIQDLIKEINEKVAEIEDWDGKEESGKLKEEVEKIVDMVA